MKIFISISAVLAWMIGALLIIAPEKLYAPAGIAMTPLLATIAQAHGATLVGLGVINWLSRGRDKRSLIAVLLGNLVVQLLSLGVVLRTMSLGAGSAVTPGVVIHVVLGGFFAFYLVKARNMNS
jgi:hypothetical protein